MDATIYHNPKCSTSCRVLALLREHGVVPVVVEYLKQPLTTLELTQLIKKMGISARELLRTKEQAYQDLGLDNGSLTDAQLIQAMVKNPALINRPIVVTEAGAALCRPAETVLKLVN